MKYEGVADFVLHYKIVSQAFYLLMPGIVGVREVTCRHLLTTNAFMPHLHDLIVAPCTGWNSNVAGYIVWTMLGRICLWQGVGYWLCADGEPGYTKHAPPVRMEPFLCQFKNKKHLYTIPDVLSFLFSTQK